MSPATSCPSCGAEGVGGLEGCRAVFDSMAEREFSDAAYFRSHRLSVDAYSLQHPEQFMLSSKSAAAHLAGMCWSLERGRSLHLPKPLKQWVNGARSYVRVEPPPLRARGVLTVTSVIDPADADDYEERVVKWATSAWAAWRHHWDQARAWVQEALAESRRGS